MSSAVVRFTESLKLLRNISHELRKALNKDNVNVKNNDMMVYIVDQYRRHDTTDQRVCRPTHELQHMADTYHSYLNSSRHYRQIYDQFYSKGELTADQTAHMLGFKMPEKYEK
ncbi:unnamed protein product [Medioppia subpectinata]|uniref:Protein FMC1 homolog n=1 Tax=Medioppia subpectinata TaxID=1979941 RepID=A0A7R9KU51_9ACAR|nr:unnamed protein product [Medioppia subpectinata]CAG2108505.1 unnamed protein product [Medioppia subpectinata]